MDAADLAEFIAFIVPRMLQLGLDGFVSVGSMEGSTALGLYKALAYLGSLSLLGASILVARQAFYDGILYLNAYTTPFIAAAAVLFVLSGFTLLAPFQGLSLRYCNVSVAQFAQLSDGIFGVGR